MNSRRLFLTGAFASAALALQACGFTPVYSTLDTGGGLPLAKVRVADIDSSDTATPILERALGRRTAKQKSDDVEYELYLAVSESAQPLQVQIDDSVRRYNYRMRGAYTLVELATGKRTTGSAQATVSFNIVSSQYSTLYSENTAREKAATTLVADIERDIIETIIAPAQAAAAVASKQQ